MSNPYSEIEAILALEGSKQAAYALHTLLTRPKIRSRFQRSGKRFRRTKAYRYVKPFKRHVWNKFARPGMKKYAMSGKPY